MNLTELFNLEAHEPDVFVGFGPRYPWGGLYGGQVVAQALWAAAATVETGMVPHSLRAYFIRKGDHHEPVRYEVDRIRTGRSFATRRVVARQEVGAVLNLEASFQRPEPSPDVHLVAMPAPLPGPEELQPAGWISGYDRRDVPLAGPAAAGRLTSWMKVSEEVPAATPLHECLLAFMTDDLPMDSIRKAAIGAEFRSVPHAFSASLDHAIWFHRPFRTDQWHLHDFTCETYVGGRGLSIGHVFDAAGLHVATVAQEGLTRLAATRD